MELLKQLIWGIGTQENKFRSARQRYWSEENRTQENFSDAISLSWQTERWFLIPQYKQSRDPPKPHIQK